MSSIYLDLNVTDDIVTNDVANDVAKDVPPVFEHLVDLGIPMTLQPIKITVTCCN